MNKLKKVLSLVCAALIGTAVFGGLTACGESTDIGVCLTNTSTTLNASIGDAITDAFPDKKVSVQSADNDVTTQINQINAFVTMGVDMIVVTPTEMTALADSLQKARNAGIKVVVSGANTDIDCYDAITVSDEYLVGQYIALLGKKWAEETYGEGGKYAGEAFDIVVCHFEDNDDAKNRSKGIRTISEPKLKNSNGDYIDSNGNVVTSASQAADNPAYLSLIENDNVNVYEEVQGLNIANGLDYMNTLMTAHPNAKLFLCYMSGFASGMSQKITDNKRYENDQYAIFAGGVSGSEPAYLCGSMEDGVGQTFTHSGSEYTGTTSIFRGAVSFGGSDAAQSLADLCQKVYSGTIDVDYQKTTTEALGVWYTVNTSTLSALAVINIQEKMGTPVRDFTPVNSVSVASSTTLADINTIIKWSKNK
jgi:ABC-type sugar transport system substrate-binding protein